MKLVPVLALTNALALGLVAVLFLQQEDLKDQLAASSRTSRRQESDTLTAEEVAKLRAEVDRLQRLAARGEQPAEAGGTPSEPLPAEETESAAIDAGSTDEPVFPSGEAPADDASGAISPESFRSMDGFRELVQKANELNRLEERRDRVVDQIEELERSNRIAHLEPRKKRQVAERVVTAQEEARAVWRRVWSDPANRDLPRDERFQKVRAEYETMRSQVQSDLERLMPAPDAKTILDAQLRGGPRMRGGPRGR